METSFRVGILLNQDPPQQRIRQPPKSKALVTNPEFVLWHRLDQLLMSWLLSSISESMLGHVMNCESAHDIWHTLELLFSTASRAPMIHLMNQLQNTKKGSLPIDENLLKMKNLVDGLRAVRNQITEEHLILYVVAGLGTDYEVVSKKPPNPNNNCTRGASNGYRGRGRNSSGGRGNNGGRGSYSQNRVIYQLFGRPAQTVQKCYRRFDISFNGSDDSNTNVPSSNSNPQALVASQSSQDDTAWYFDSGASKHVTSDSSNLQQQAPNKGK
uniref:Uncharacterized protein n=1 Tax=Cannabis sativa TaxID=3483 RepID=A0A803Q8T6_CANSA